MLKYLGATLLVIEIIYGCGSAESKSICSEQQVYDQAMVAFIQETKTPGKIKDFDVIWARNLKELAKSQSKQADSYLVEIAFFNLDGVAGEEYSCAASFRIIKYGKLFSNHLQASLKEFDKVNPCFVMADKQQVAREKLCATKEAFARLVRDYAQYHVNAETEASCSY